MNNLKYKDTIIGGLENALSNAEHNSKLPIPWIDFVEPNNIPIAIVGGGSTLKKTWQSLKAKQNKVSILTTNRTINYLAQRGIRTDFHVLFDPQEVCKTFLRNDLNAIQLIASQCHPNVFKEAIDPILYHAVCDHSEEHYKQIVKDPHHPMIGGGSTGIHRSLAIAYVLGYRTFYLYGFDCCFGEASHAYTDEHKEIPKQKIEMNKKQFTVSSHNVRMLDEYKDQAGKLKKAGVFIRSYGRSPVTEITKDVFKTN